MNVFTIGFTKKSAEKFFNTLKSSGARLVIDVRLNNLSQLSGFAKKDDLAYFLREMCGVDYVHLSQFAPTKEMLNDFRKSHKDWKIYETQFLNLMRERSVEKYVSKQLIENSCLLCSEDKPHHCHRRLVAQYLNEHWGDIEVCHL